MGAAAMRGQAALLLGQAGLAAGLLFGSAAPRIRARHCRAKIGGVADPATSPVSARSSPRHPSRGATMHDAAHAFHHAMAIGAAKSVSFEKKTVLDL